MAIKITANITIIQKAMSLNSIFLHQLLFIFPRLNNYWWSSFFGKIL